MLVLSVLDKKEKPRLSRKKVALSIVLLVVLIPLYFTWTASSELDDKVNKLEEDIAKFRASESVERSSRFGPTVEGNAVDYYRAIEAVTNKESTGTVPETVSLGPLEEYRTQVGPDFMDCNWKLEGQLEADVRNHAASAETLEQLKLTPEDREVLETYRPLIELVKKALIRGRVDWEVKYEKGQLMEYSTVRGLQFLIGLMSQDARENQKISISSAKQIIAVGEDYTQSPWWIQVNRGSFFKRDGYRILQEAMERSLSQSEYRDIIQFLMSVKTSDLKRQYECRLLINKVHLAHMSQRSVSNVGRDEVEGPFFKRTCHIEGGEVDEPFFKNSWKVNFSNFVFNSSIHLNHQWTELNHFTDEQLNSLLEAPESEFQQKYDEVDARLTESGAIVAILFAQDIGGSLERFAMEVNEPKLVALLAAAHLHRLEFGSFPNKIDALAQYFPKSELPKYTHPDNADPFLYELRDKELTVSFPKKKGRLPVIYKTWTPK